VTFDLQQILASKRDFRRALVGRAISEKLAMLDALRARALAFRAARESTTATATLQEDPAPYQAAPTAAP
jgi:hypothetical protein